jgi:superfamily II DNA/RNA helicase
MSKICSGENKQIEKWEDLNLKTEILRGIYSYGFENPSEIQKKAIQSMIAEKDIIAQAQSGSGKTGAFSVSTLQLIDPKINEFQALIMAPTRELAIQIYNVINSLGTQIKNLRSHLLIGGTSTETDIASLQENTPHIIVGCPGRIHDMMRRKHINTKTIKVIILDEADEMLSSGFKEQVYNIFQFLNSNVQVGLFSATMPHELGNLTEKFMRNPVKILVRSENLTLEGINQYYVGLEDDGDKYETLKDIYGSISVNQCIIYCNSLRRVSDLHEAMNQDGYPVCCIHSGMEKQERTQNYQDFKKGKYRILISSNVTARGIDIQQVSTVINFDIPKCIHTYLHRIGRSGRWGRRGVAINFTTKRDYKNIKDIESQYKIKIEELPSNFNV